MLGKLIKNDLKSSVRGVFNIYIAAFIATAAMGISLFTDFGAGKTLSSLALIIISFIAVIITIVSMFSDFRKTMFGDRGYLTNTLPVRSYSLLFSKWLVSMIWITVSCLFVGFSFALVYSYYMGSESVSTFSMLLEMLPTMGLPAKDVIFKILPMYSAKILFWLAVNVAIVYFSVTISNIKPFQALGTFGVIIAFFLIFAFVNIAGNKLDSLASMAILVNFDGSMSLSFDRQAIQEVIYTGGAFVSLTQIYFELIAAIILFIINSELIEKKINVK